MTEPVYHYIKDQGWVAIPSDHIVTLFCGTVVRLEFRFPKPGERWDSAVLPNDRFFRDGQPVWEEWICCFSCMRLCDLCDHVPTYFTEGFIVVVPL